MAGIVPLDAEPIGQEIVELLEGALVQAQNGELSSVALSMVYRDGSTGQAWSKPPSVGAMMGSVARLLHRLNVMLDDG